MRSEKVSSSPFSNAIVFVDNSADTALPESFTVEVRDKITNGSAVILTLAVDDDNPALFVSLQKPYNRLEQLLAESPLSVMAL